MKIRRFFAQDMRQAIRLVREAQGEDAVILSSRTVEGGIEVVSAVDYDEEAVNRMAAHQAGASQARAAPAELPLRAVADDPEFIEPVMDVPRIPPPIAREAAPEVVWSQDPALVAMQREIESLRGMLQDQLASLAWNDFRRREPQRVQLINRLGLLGVDESLARDIAAQVRHVDSPDRAWQEALDNLAARVAAAAETVLEGEGVIALVGPSGVGKTTTLAKLAARHVRRRGRDSIALVTTDSDRIGAYRQLQAIGQILGVPVHLAQTGRQLGDILMGLGDKERILVDTAGMSQRDVRLVEEMAGLTAIPRLRTLLVLAANAQQAVLQETLRAFGHLPLTGMVLTKVDEAASLGPALSALCGAELPLLYVSEGQRVPQDLQPAQVSDLVTRAVSLVEERRSGQVPASPAPTVTHAGLHGGRLH
jgi:flagellar biosynthesis protein FlhF